jgi:peptide/nickel transport system substrate-binding protein
MVHGLTASSLRRSVAVSLFALATAAALTPLSVQAQSKGDIVVATSILSQHNDPTAVVSTADYMVDDMLYDGLTNIGGKGKYPALAESWTISPDGKQIDFHLRKGVKFSNGDPFSSEDVKFTFDRIIAPDSTHAYRRGFVDSIDHIETPDPYTARFILKNPWPAFFSTSRYGLAHIVPKKYYEKVGPAGFQEKPIGTGPFKLVGSKAGEWSKFEANENYWAGAPKVKTVTERLVAEPFTRYAMMERGEADIATALTGALLDKVRANKDLKVIMSPYSGVSGNLFNKEAFPEAKDKRVRLAIAYAINRKDIAEKLLGGVCEPATSIFSPGTFGYLDGLPQIPYDPAKAKALLKEAGVKPGLKVSFLIHTQAFTALPGAPQVLEAIAGNLEAVGFALDRKPVDTDAWMSLMHGGKQPGIFYAPSGTPDDGGELINTWFSIKSVWTNHSIDVPEYEQIFKDQQQNPDPKQRLALLNKFAKLESENMEMVPLLWCATPYAVGKRIKSWHPAMGSGYNLNLDELELN